MKKLFYRNNREDFDEITERIENAEFIQCDDLPSATYTDTDYLTKALFALFLDNEKFMISRDLKEELDTYGWLN